MSQHLVDTKLTAERLQSPAYLFSVILLASCGGTSGESTPAPATTPATTTTEAVASKPAISDSRIKQIITEVMHDQYDGRGDVALSCWNYSFKENNMETAYCMKPGAPQIVDTATGRRLYLPVSNIIESDSTEAYGAVTPGLMGAFLVEVGNDGQWSYLARERGLAFGTMGYCGCDKADFVQLGPDYYGWKFTSGGTWQGITVSNHEIVAPHQGGFKDISDIPELREESPDVVYSLEIAKANDARNYPLTVIKRDPEGKQTKAVIEFDPAKWTYRMPDHF